MDKNYKEKKCDAWTCMYHDERCEENCANLDKEIDVFTGECISYVHCELFD